MLNLYLKSKWEVIKNVYSYDHAMMSAMFIFAVLFSLGAAFLIMFPDGDIVAGISTWTLIATAKALACFGFSILILLLLMVGAIMLIEKTGSSAIGFIWLGYAVCLIVWLVAVIVFSHSSVVKLCKLL